jgi:hypothetical protein
MAGSATGQVQDLGLLLLKAPIPGLQGLQMCAG